MTFFRSGGIQGVIRKLRSVISNSRADTGAAVIKTEEKSPTHPLIGRSTAFAISQVSRQKLRSEVPMILPKDSLILWKDPIIVGPKEKSEIEKSRCISLLFAFNKDDAIHHIALRRPLDEPFPVLSDKVSQKVNKLLNSKNKKQQKLKGAQDSYWKDNYIQFPFHPLGMEEEQMEHSLVEFVFDSISSIRVGDRIFRIIREPIDVANVQIPLRALVGCPVIPAIDYRINTNVSSSQLLLFHWFVKSNPKSPLREDSLRLVEGSSRHFAIDDCSFRSTGPIYYPQEEDIGKKLVAVCDLGNDCIVRAAISKREIEKLPEEPLYLNRSKDFEQTPVNGSIRLLTYNVLADLYLNLNGPQETLFFPYCAKEYQLLDFRYPMILRELRDYNADILFLQEVDHRMQIRYLGSMAEENEYKFRFQKKDREVGEGCVVMWKKNRFSYCASSGHSLASLLSDHDDIIQILESSQETKEIITTRPTILQIVLLKCLSSGKTIICGNTHLHHNPEHDHIKALQALVAVRKVAEIAKTERENGNDVVVLLGGDFNSTPDGSVYQLLSNGKLSVDHPCWTLDQNIKPIDLTLSRYFENGLLNLTGETCTNYTKYKDDQGEFHGFEGCLDYIWSCSSVRVSRNLPLPCYDEVVKFNGLPSPHQSSDHLALIVEVNL